ncbi:DDE-type integrase/transposase/recombinase [Sulfitobacter sp. NFXS29]|uniref:DDE-type integrase/transposase/recombinase n=1 Tax=Sulfitobacter sp. NFXS29 TaxID=2818438 RepID=UPI0032DF662F
MTGLPSVGLIVLCRCSYVGLRIEQLPRQSTKFRTVPHRPVTIVTDKAQTYRRVIREINHRYDPHFDSIRHIDRKWCNNLIESDHAAMKRLLGYRQSFRSLRSAKATLSGNETIRTIKRDNIHHKQPGVQGKIKFISQLFADA